MATKRKAAYRGYRCSRCGRWIKTEPQMHGGCSDQRSHILSINAMFDDRFWEIAKA